MVRDLLIRGMLAGLVAGLLAFGFAKMFGEPQVDRAIAFEQQHEAAGAPAHHEHAGAQDQDAATAQEAEPEDGRLVSRKVQNCWPADRRRRLWRGHGRAVRARLRLSLWARRRIGPRMLALLLAAGAFAALYYVPSLKYPANPPAIGNWLTIGTRTGLYFLMLLISLGGLSSPWPRAGGWPRPMAAQRDADRRRPVRGIIGAALLALPDINEVPPDFPPSCCGNSAWPRSGRRP